MTKKVRTRPIIAIFGVVVVAILCVASARKLLRTETRTMTGTIVRLDAAKRVATLELVHPKTGRTIQVEGYAPADCEIRIDGKPAAITDLKVGDRAEVEGVIHWDRSISANWVHVLRTAPTAPTSSPATQPATAPTQPVGHP
jgi:hypothetical protein